MQSIKDIKQLFEQAEKEQWNALFSQYKTDERNLSHSMRTNS